MTTKIKTIEELGEELKNLSPEFGQWRMDRNLAVGWLKETLTQRDTALKEEILERLEGMSNIVDCAHNDSSMCDSDCPYFKSSRDFYRDASRDAQKVVKDVFNPTKEL